MEQFPRFADFILVLIFGIFLPFVSGIRSARVFRENDIRFDRISKRKFYLGNSFFLFILAFIILLVWFLFRRPFYVLGFAKPVPTPYHLHWWLTGLFGILYLLDSLYSVFDPQERERSFEEMQQQTPFMPGSYSDLPAYVLMCVAAGVCEEIVFRGYMITFFRYLFEGLNGAPALAVLLPSLIFSLAHYYQGIKTVFKILVLSTLFGMIFWHSGSLYIVMLLHFGVDLLSGIFSIHIARKSRS